MKVGCARILAQILQIFKFALKLESQIKDFFEYLIRKYPAIKNLHLQQDMTAKFGRSQLVTLISISRIKEINFLEIKRIFYFLNIDI